MRISQMLTLIHLDSKNIYLVIPSRLTPCKILLKIILILLCLCSLSWRWQLVVKVAYFPPYFLQGRIKMNYLLLSTNFGCKYSDYETFTEVNSNFIKFKICYFYYFFWNYLSAHVSKKKEVKHFTKFQKLLDDLAMRQSNQFWVLIKMVDAPYLCVG